jgi:transcriptional regulator with PAS, ATPase and Fis domain
VIADGLVGSSESMTQLRAYLPKLARSDVSVLITGETGTGKVRIAELLHAESARRVRPLIPINCAAVPEHLFESELFGHARGSFTGAVADYPGKLRLAEGGTMFLDEIGDMSPMAQAKLLRVLETREIFPVGGRSAVPFDVRFVAATNQDLEMLVEQQQFRRDLYYRLNVARISVPPLRDRPEDIAVLFRHFLKQVEKRFGSASPEPTPEVLEKLRRYPWPGNARELRNLIECLFVAPPTDVIRWVDLPESFRRTAGRASQVPSSERDRLVAALEATNWNKSRAAAEIRCSRMTLYRRLAKFHVERSPDPEAVTLSQADVTTARSAPHGA